MRQNNQAHSRSLYQTTSQRIQLLFNTALFKIAHFGPQHPFAETVAEMNVGAKIFNRAASAGRRKVTWRKRRSCPSMSKRFSTRWTVEEAWPDIERTKRFSTRATRQTQLFTFRKARSRSALFQSAERKQS